ncbi:MAG: hypothetical protein V1784_06725 [bacterium]
MELPAVPLGSFRLTVSYELSLGKPYFHKGGYLLGKISRSIDLEVLELSPERRECVEQAIAGLFDLDSLGINHYFELRKQLEKSYPQSGIVNALDVAFSHAMIALLPKPLERDHGRPVLFNLFKAEDVLLDVAHRYADSPPGESALCALFFAYQNFKAQTRGLQVFGKLANENRGTDLGMWATYNKSRIENNWRSVDEVHSLERIRRQYYGKQKQ